MTKETGLHDAILDAAELLRRAKRVVAFTGAGISVESGLAPFRGPGGLWERHNPDHFHAQYFRKHPAESWAEIKALFYDHIGKATPNPAHFALAELEQSGPLQAVITQNIDGLHTQAGSREVYEYHGTIRRLTCVKCKAKHPHSTIDLSTLPPVCPVCTGLLRPGIVFFGDPIPEQALRQAASAVEACDIMLVVGSTGEVQPAARLPHLAKNRAGAAVIEVNIHPSSFTRSITDIFLQGPAADTLTALTRAVLGSK